jgi:putative PIN family toxin of toxin-antitoxin system
VPTRAVFDTNIWISGLLWHGKSYQCLMLAHAGLLQVVYCRQMLAELATKLRDKFGFSENRLQSVLYNLQRVAERIEITGTLHAVSNDPDDDMFIECAMVSGAHWIVSEDRHLLALAQYEGISILTAAEFIAHMDLRLP